MNTVCLPMPNVLALPKSAWFQSRLSRFLVASFALHVLLLVPWAFSFRFAAQPETVLSVSFDTPRADVTPAASSAGAAATRIRSPARSNRDFAQMTSASAIAENARTASDNSPSPNPGSASDSDGNERESIRARVEAQLFTDLQRQFEYPLLARRQGWHGTVWLSFTIEPDGALDRIKVASSSGHDLLDTAAVAAMRRVGKLTQASHWLNGLSLDMSIPVIYRLQDR